MKDLRFKRRVAPERLHAELTEAILELRPVEEEGGLLRSPFEIEQPTPDSLVLRVPDDLADGPIAAIVQAHDPAPLRTAEELDEIIDGATDLDELKAAAKEIVRRL